MAKTDHLDANDPIFVHELISDAWGLIANAGEGNWERESPAWQKAAVTWRDNWHRYLRENTMTTRGAREDEYRYGRKDRKN